MKILCQTSKFEKSIAAGDYRDSFWKWMGSRTTESMPTVYVDLFESKTPTQLHTIFRDFGIIARLLYTDKDTIYAESMRHKELRDFFIKETEYGLQTKRKKSIQLHTLSQSSKVECMEFIPLYRDVWQGIINEQYGEFVIINWSKEENREKPDFERIKENEKKQTS